jgi:uncharacterized glyoxalase superfamily protein PhnB
MAQTIFPSFTYEDAEAAIGWLGAALGFEPQAVHRDDAGTVAHAELRLGDQMIMLGTARSPDPLGRVGPARAGGVTCLTYIAIDDPDALFQRATGAGAEVVMPLTDTDYGSRDFSVRDPEGHVWSFGTYRPEV